MINTNYISPTSYTGFNKAAGIPLNVQEKKESEVKDVSKLKPNGEKMSDSEAKEVQNLKSTDQKVRQHEQAHLAVGGSIVVSGPNYQYQIGADGRRYAVAGEVVIDNSPVAGDAEATISKMQHVQRTALAPADPSAQDRAVASQAAQTEMRARSEAMQEKFMENKKRNANIQGNHKFTMYKNQFELTGKFLDLISAAGSNRLKKNI